MTDAIPDEIMLEAEALHTMIRLFSTVQYAVSCRSVQNVAGTWRAKWPKFTPVSRKTVHVSFAPIFAMRLAAHNHFADARNMVWCAGEARTIHSTLHTWTRAGDKSLALPLITTY